MNTIFDLLYEDFKFNKNQKVKLFEAFAGIGMQRMAMNKLGANYECVGISEIDKYAIKSYRAIHGPIKNYGSICDINGLQLPQIDIFTWSFPCTDLSKAGKQKGLSTETRSGLVYEVLRILQECSVYGNLPKVLIMENVVDLIQVKFIKQFQEIQLELEKLGYTNFTETLNSKHYGIPQNRNRVFMVSILGEYNYEFPKKIPLKLRLKDLLEDEVDEKYYLSQKAIKGLLNTNFSTAKLENITKDPKLVIEDVIQVGNLIDDNEINFKNPQAGRVYSEYGISPCLNTMQGGGREPKILIKEDTTKGYAEATDGDGVYINRPHQKRGVVQKDMIQTLKTSCADVGVCVPVLTPDRVKKRQNGRRFKNDGEPMFTLTTQDRHGILIGSTQKNASINTDGICSALTSAMGTGGGHVPMYSYNGLTIRKLLPLECWRLMGISDEDFYKAQKVNSSSQLYRQAGNGIVVDVFAAILRNLFEEE